MKTFLTTSIVTWLMLSFAITLISEKNSTSLNSVSQSNAANMCFSDSKSFTHKTNDSNYNFYKAFRSATSEYATLHTQYTHESRYLPKIKLVNDAKNFRQQFTGYWGIAANQRFDAVQIMKDSNFNHFTIAFANPLASENTNSKNNLGANYWDQIQEIHSMGGEVTMAFGGASYKPTSFFNNAPSAFVMYQKLFSICMAYRIYSFDFDLEVGHTLSYDTDEFNALAHALALLRTSVKNVLNEELQVRFTVANLNSTFIDKFCSIYNPTGGDVIWNDMSFTSLSITSQSQITPHSISNPLSNSIHTLVKYDVAILKKSQTYTNKTPNYILHHIGITANINEPYNASHEDYVNYFQDYHDEACAVGLFGIWSISNDHKKNSTLDPEGNHQNVNIKKDFWFTRLIANFVNENFANWNNSSNTLPKVQNLKIYSKSSQYIIWKWNPVKNAKFYKISVSNDAANPLNSWTTICEVDRTTAAFSLRREYPDRNNNLVNLKTWPKIDMRIVAVSYSQEENRIIQSEPNISSVDNPLLSTNSILSQGQTEYWDTNIDYKHFDVAGDVKGVFATATKYIYYHGHVYQYIKKINSSSTHTNNERVDGNGPLKDEWKQLNVVLDINHFGLSAERIIDLKNFEFPTKVAPLQTLTFVKGENTKARDYAGIGIEFTTGSQITNAQSIPNRLFKYKITIALLTVAFFMILGYFFWKLRRQKAISNNNSRQLVHKQQQLSNARHSLAIIRRRKSSPRASK